MADYIKRIRTENGDMQIDYQALANLPKSDTGLSISGAFADAKITGDKFKAVNLIIDNIMNGKTTAPTISAADLKAKNFTLDGSAVKSYDLTMGSVASGKILSTNGAINLAHSHAVIVNDDGTITLGEVSSKGGNFKIADTKAYKEGVSAAINSVTLSTAGWVHGTNIVKASNGQSVTINLPPFSASGGTSFDSSNKTKVFFYTSSVSGPLKTVEVDASGVYASGQTAGINGVTLSKSWKTGTITVTASNGKNSTATLSKGTESWSGNACSFPIMDGSTSTELTCSVDATARYNAGVSSVTVPNANVVRNADDAYNSSDHSTTVAIKATASNGKYGTQTFTVSGQKAYNAGYSAGNTAGSGAVTLSKSWSGGILTVKASNGITSTAQLSKGTESWSDNTCSFPINDGQGSTGYTCKVDASARYAAGVNSVTVPSTNIVRQAADQYNSDSDHSTTIYIKAQASNGATGLQSFTVSGKTAYDAGYSAGSAGGSGAVTLSKSWSGGILTVKASNGITSTAQLSKGTETWDGNTCSFPIMDGQGSTGYTCTVDAAARYTAGANSVTLSGSWSSGVYTVTASNGKTSKGYAGISSVTWGEGAKGSVHLVDNAGNRIANDVTIDASSVYTKGQTAGANGVTLSKSWNGGTLTVSASNGKTSTAQISKGTETWDGNTCSFPVMDGQGSTGYTITVNAAARYTAGANSVTVSSKTWKNGIFTATMSNGVTATTTISKGKETLSGNTYSIPIACDTSGSTGYTITVDASERYTAGANSVTLSGSWSGGVYTVTASNGQVSKGYAGISAVTWDQDTKGYVYLVDNAGNKISSNVTIDASSVYTKGQTAGANSVTLSKSWSGGILSVKASNGQSSTAQLSKGTETWDGNSCSFAIMDGQGSTGYTCKVDASARYTAGVNSVTVPNTNITRQAADSYAGGDDHSTTVYIRAQASNGKYGTQSFSVSGASAYNAGHNAGANTLSISPSEAVTLGYGASQTITATTTNAAGTAVTKSVTITAPSDNYNTGWNACRDACSLATVYTISENSPGTLYMKVGDAYSSVGSSWVKVSPKYGVYYLPGAKS